jgi:hypothetical protein
MTRSILWISSRAPSLPFSIGCVALPQPRSRMALAADIRAVAVASLLRMTPTRTLSAVLVWLRASERISVRVLGIWNLRWTLSHAACRHVRACRLIKGSDGSSLAALRRRRVGRMWRRGARLPSDSKSPQPVSRRGLNSCDVEFMPVICPTCQIFCVTLANAFLFKSLDRRRGLAGGNRFGSFGNWRRGHAGNGFGSSASRRWTNLGGRLFPGSDAGLSCMPGLRSRCGSPHSPGTRDRRSCRISNERACHRAHGSQDNRSRHCPQGGISSTILGSCFRRHKCPCDQGANKQLLHRGSPRMRREGHGTPKLRRHKGDVANGSAKAIPDRFGALCGFDRG